MCSTGSYMPSCAGVTGWPNFICATEDTNVIVACTPIVSLSIGTIAWDMSRHQLPR